MERIKFPMDKRKREKNYDNPSSEKFLKEDFDILEKGTIYDNNIDSLIIVESCIKIKDSNVKIKIGKLTSLNEKLNLEPLFYEESFITANELDDYRNQISSRMRMTLNNRRNSSDCLKTILDKKSLIDLDIKRGDKVYWKCQELIKKEGLIEKEIGSTIHTKVIDQMVGSSMTVIGFEEEGMCIPIPTKELNMNSKIFCIASYYIGFGETIEKMELYRISKLKS